MVRRDYQKEILEKLAENGGCVTGVRELMRIGGFYPTPFREHLKKMVQLELIRITKENNKNRICIVDLEFDNEFKKNTKNLESLDTHLYRSDLKDNEKLLLIGNYLKIALHQYHNYDVSLLYAQSIQPDTRRIEIIKAAKNKLWENMGDILLRLDENSRIGMINSLFNVLEVPLSLEEYRENQYIPSRKEILVQKRLEERQIQEDYDRYQKYCQICGKKNPPSYKEGTRHRQRHGERIFAIIKHGGWHCQYCGKKLPLDRVKARKHQETHRI